jgi:hypothetical protein
MCWGGSGRRQRAQEQARGGLAAEPPLVLGAARLPLQGKRAPWTTLLPPLRGSARHLKAAAGRLRLRRLGGGAQAQAARGWRARRA